MNEEIVLYIIKRNDDNDLKTSDSLSLMIRNDDKQWFISWNYRLIEH
jgi:hypothetical protein